jgi:hypothetical protein
VENPPNILTQPHRKIRLIEGNANFFVTKVTCKRPLRQLFEAPLPSKDFVLKWASNFVGSESGHIKSVKDLLNMVSKMSQDPPPQHTVYI